MTTTLSVASAVVSAVWTAGAAAVSLAWSVGGTRLSTGRTSVRRTLITTMLVDSCRSAEYFDPTPSTVRLVRRRRTLRLVVVGTYCGT